jgi:phosphoglycolate phosphatase
MKYRCIIFDCDGTLLDTLEDIAAAMNQALTLHGFSPVPLEKYRDMVGWGIFRLATLALPEEARTESNIQSIGTCAERLMNEQPVERYLTKPYPGIRELLAELSALKTQKSKKITLAVLSNKPDSVLRNIMDKYFPPLTFDAVCGLHPGVSPKPDPSSVWEMLAAIDRSPGDTIFVGDSEIDIETAKNSGCYPLGVSWGFRSRATLERAGAARIIDKPEELWELLGGR